MRTFLTLVGAAAMCAGLAVAADTWTGKLMDADCHAKRRELERVLEQRFDLTHTTLQVDHAGNGEAIHLGTAERRIGPL